MKSAILSFETLSLALVFILISLETLLRFLITGFYYIFPFPNLLENIYDTKAFGFLRSIFNRGLHQTKATTDGMCTIELLQHWGYECEEHVAETSDGFSLVMHRIIRKQNGKRIEPTGYPILVMHGLMMCDEAFVFDESVSLPFALTNNNYDVWLCNNRGNKYSWIHKSLDRNSTQYWNYSIDELARYDLPTIIHHVLNTTKYSTVGYVGFSNGTAQMFAALSSNASLNKKVSLFVAVGPACRITTIHTNKTFVYPMVSSTLSVFQLVFGNRAMLTTADAWKRLLASPTLVKLIDLALKVLFNWSCDNATKEIKSSLYQHIYSTTSVKCVYHWFQMLGSGKFEHFKKGSGTQGEIYVPSYDIQRITTPIVLVYGGRDQLTDINWLKTNLHHQLQAEHVIPHYEHLDFLCASDCQEQVHIPIIKAFKGFAEKYSKISIEEREGSAALLKVRGTPMIDQHTKESSLKSNTEISDCHSNLFSSSHMSQLQNGEKERMSYQGNENGIYLHRCDMLEEDSNGEESSTVANSEVAQKRKPFTKMGLQSNGKSLSPGLKIRAAWVDTEDDVERIREENY